MLYTEQSVAQLLKTCSELERLAIDIKPSKDFWIFVVEQIVNEVYVVELEMEAVWRVL